jgi:dihydroceramide fatty acyl 2-hydroxylase
LRGLMRGAQSSMVSRVSERAVSIATPAGPKIASSGPAADRLSASPRLFENPILDRLSRVHWYVPPAVYGPCVLALLVVSFRTLAPGIVLLGAIVGYFAWTLTEYLGHRFLFHASLPGKIGARLHLLLHGVHHDHPNDPLRLVMPVLLSAPILMAALLVARTVVGLPGGFAVMAGYVLGYLGYDLTHYYLHHGAPTSRLGRALRRNHMRHHFREPERGFGVSAPWWDHVFGTAHPDPGTVPAQKPED